MAKNDNQSITYNLDWTTIGLYAACVVMGVMSVYAAIFDPDDQTKLIDLGNNAGKQLMFVGTSFLLAIAVLAIDHKFWEVFAPVIYGIFLVSLVAVIFLGSAVDGSHSFFKLGGFTLQPAEFTKISTTLMLSRFVAESGINLKNLKDQLYAFVIIGVPAALILLSNETGVTLVYASFLIMLYREGIPAVYPFIIFMATILFFASILLPKLVIVGVLGGVLLFIIFVVIPKHKRIWGRVMPVIAIFVAMIAFVLSVEFIFNNVLQPHQRNRIIVLFDDNVDRRGIGWNVNQSKIAIGSGGLWGKGYLEGTQTKFNFVPAQHTDFIFCTIGEEYGFVGSTLFIILYILLIFRIFTLAERQRYRFGRNYGYCIGGIFFFHFLINIGMTMGLVPVVGIPLPFFSYGGSSIWTFTVMLFILLRIDSQRSYSVVR